MSVLFYQLKKNNIRQTKDGHCDIKKLICLNHGCATTIPLVVCAVAGSSLSNTRHKDICLSSFLPSITLMFPSLSSEMGWTGGLWSNTNTGLNCKTKTKKCITVLAKIDEE